MRKDYTLRRDPLDYILTDSTPVETSELFTYTYMYEYFHALRSDVDKILKDIEKNEKNNFSHSVPFTGGWNTMPLDFKIQKNDGGFRKMCIPQPLSVMNMYYFISLYQRDILSVVSRPHFSIRYPVRNSDLFYTRKSKRLIDYQYKRDRTSKKAVEQSGRYFDIRPHRFILDFELSEDWRIMNLKYKYFCKLDYKRCFDSVYTHTYKWLSTKDVVDSRVFKNSSLYAVIDRVLQNINGSFSNGVPIGPEFSRLMVEILMQAIDKSVHDRLLKEGIRKDVEYSIMRYVDDMYIFCSDVKIQDRILKLIDEEAAKYMLEINKLKTEKHETPYLRSEWLKDVDEFSSNLRKVFRYDSAIQEQGEDYQIKCRSKDINKLKEEFENLIAKYKDNSQTILNYVLMVIYNAVSLNQKYKIFKDPKHPTVSYVLDLLLFIYSQSVTFNNTHKLISLLYYFDHECDLKGSKTLQSKIYKYEEYIAESYYSEHVNLLVAFSELKVNFRVSVEDKLLANIIKADDPIALATYLYYSKYNDELFSATKASINKILKEKMNNIINYRDAFLYREIWYILIFNKCPYIDPLIQKDFDRLLKKIALSATPGSAGKAIKLTTKFMLDKKERHSFIVWNKSGAKMLQEITFRTAHRTVFRNRSGRLMASL